MTHSEILTPDVRAAQPCTLVWLRRDLRLEDHAALAAALNTTEALQPVFIFDATILDAIPRATTAVKPATAAQQSICQDRRVAFIHAAVSEMAQRIQDMGGHLITRHGDPRQLIVELAQALNAVRVVFAHDDEPDALDRDAEVASTLKRLGIACLSVKDQCVFERREVLTGSGKPFSVFTPYKNAWIKRLTPEDVAEKKVGERLRTRLLPLRDLPKSLTAKVPDLAALGFGPGNLFDLKIPLGESGAQELFGQFKPRIGRYHEARDYPAARGPSYLSVHLRFGTISIRELVRFALKVQQSGKDDAAGAAIWLSELIWRDFYMQILANYPHVVGHSFKREYDAIVWASGQEAEAHFAAWCDGRTGYPLVDAAMRQLNATGYMHNRLRMVVASFLTKDLGIDWRRGEAYFAWKLNDFDLSANNGGWQWAASTGCDAQPYFRIFNPISQSERFDPKGAFIRRYVPEIAGLSDKAIHAPWDAKPLELQESGVRLGITYPMPIVDHAQAREKTLMRFSAVRQ